MKKILLLSALILSLDLLSQNYTDSVACRQTINMYKKIETKLQSNKRMFPIINCLNEVLSDDVGTR